MKIFKKPALAALFGSTALVSGHGALAQEAEQAPPVAEEAETEEIVVRGIFIPDEMKATSEVAALLDEEDFARTGDSDIGAALQRVTGISLSQGRFVIVRGLNDRYSSVTLDGSTLPSPEPLRRVVPLDIVPTSVLSGTLVQKTFSPQYSGEFGGGLVELRSRAIPDAPYLNVGVSIGGDSETWGQDGLTYDGDGSDSLGFDNGTRDKAPALAAFFGRTLPTNVGQEALDTSIEFTRTTVIFDDPVPPNSGIDVSFGSSYDLNETMRIGANVALGFSNDWQTRSGRREQGLIGDARGADSRPFALVQAGTLGNNARLFDFTRTEQTIDANALAAIGLEVGDDHTFTWTNLLLRSTVKEARNERGLRSEDPNLDIFRENLSFTERQVWQTQLRGEHVFPGFGDLEVVWRAAYGEALRDAPYQWEFARFRTAANQPYRLGEIQAQPGQTTFARWGNTVVTNPISLAFSRIDDQNAEYGLDFTYPTTIAGQEVEVRFGAAYVDKLREAVNRDFLYREGNTFRLPVQVIDARNDVVLAPGVAGTDAINLAYNSGQDALDNAKSGLKVGALYVGVESELGPFLRLAAGGRFESATQTTSAFRTGFQNAGLRTALSEEYFLPAATLTWNPIGDLQLRFGYSQTITRPQFRELTPAIFVDDETDQRILGNPFLVDSEIDNFDARAEYYFARGQFVTLGLFYKDISKPIETTSAFIGEEQLQTYVNAPSAELYGVEFEFERFFPLGELFGNEALSTTDLLVKVNYTWSQSEVSAQGRVIEFRPNQVIALSRIDNPANAKVTDGRQLQGQSEHLFNVQLGVDDVEKAFRATFLVNYASERIRQTEDIRTGVRVPAVFEQPPLTLDFVASKGFDNVLGGGWEVGFELRNILGEDYEATQSGFRNGGTADYDTYELGTSVSFSLKKRL